MMCFMTIIEHVYLWPPKKSKSPTAKAEKIVVMHLKGFVATSLKLYHFVALSLLYVLSEQNNLIESLVILPVRPTYSPTCVVMHLKGFVT